MSPPVVAFGPGGSGTRAQVEDGWPPNHPFTNEADVFQASRYGPAFSRATAASIAFFTTAFIVA